MNSILLIFTAVLFYFLGRYAGKEQEVLAHIQKTLKKKPYTGPIDYITPEEQRYQESGEKEKDNAIATAWKKAGLKL